MRFPCTPLMLMALASCVANPQSDPRPGEARLLAGTWDLVVHRKDHPDILGSVTLAPSEANDSYVPSPLKGGTLEGHFRLQDVGWLPHLPADSGTSAYLDADGSVVLYLRLEGRCANCGNLGFAGHLGADGVTGHWSQEYSTDPPEGTFELQRSTTY